MVNNWKKLVGIGASKVQTYMSRNASLNGPRRALQLTAFAAASAMTLAGMLAVSPAYAANTAYYVDCSASTNGSGTSTSPWNSLASPNATTFGAGDSLLFNRGTTCSGELIAKGSGTSSAPITIADYGTGALPILDGGTVNTSTILLNDVEYYDIKNLAVRGSSTDAVQITGSTASRALHHFHLIGLDISAVNHVATTRNDSALLNIGPNATGETISDVLIDGVTAHDTTAGDGISVGGGITGTNNIVQNSVVHDVRGDGIVVWQTTNGKILNSVAYNTGLCSGCSGSTPVGIWTWNSNGMLLQGNESYANHTFPGSMKDGGGYDVDGQNSNNTLQYNYAHDNEGYCVSVFDWGKTATVNTVIRYNICANNVQKDVSIGEIFTSTWQSGHLNGVQIYNNTVYANPAATAANNAYSPINDGSAYTGSIPNFFKNNIVYSASPASPVFETLSSTYSVDNNVWWNSAGGTPKWGGSSSFASYQGTGRDVHGKFADPLLNGVGYHSEPKPDLTNNAYTLRVGSPALGAGTNVCATSCLTGNMGTQDFYGNPLPATHNVGAYEGAAR